MQSISNKRTFHLTDIINNESTSKLSSWFRERLEEDKDGWISLLITCSGGVIVYGFSFVDYVMEIRKARLQTTALGYVDSMAIPVFMCGEERIVTPRSSFLFHELGRSFSNNERRTTSELKRVSDELAFQEKQYSEFVSSRTSGKLSADDVLDLMRKETRIFAEDAIRLGLAHEISGK